MADQKFVVWRLHDGRWSRATQPLPADEATRIRNAGNDARLHGDIYKVLPEHETPR